MTGHPAQALPFQMESSIAGRSRMGTEDGSRDPWHKEGHKDPRPVRDSGKLPPAHLVACIFSCPPDFHRDQDYSYS